MVFLGRLATARRKVYYITFGTTYCGALSLLLLDSLAGWPGSQQLSAPNSLADHIAVLRSLCPGRRS